VNDDPTRQVADVIGRVMEIGVERDRLRTEERTLFQQLGDEVGRSTILKDRQLKQLFSAAQEYRAERDVLRLVAGAAEAVGTDQLSAGAFVENAGRTLGQMEGVDFSSVMLFDDEGHPTLLYPEQMAEEDDRVLREHLSSGILRKVWLEGEAVYCEEATADSDLGGLKSVQTFQLRTVLCCPIRDDMSERVRGALYLHNRNQNDAFPEAWREAVRMLAAQMAQQLALLERRRGPGADPTQPYRTRGRYREIVGTSECTARLLDAIDQIVARKRPPSVLILGETGVGKELVARALHRHGPRSDGPFVAVNMANLPETLADAELFGSVKGAFTGAVNREGLFTRASGGVLFLDEIGDVPVEVQAKLLRVLDEREVRPLGSNRQRAVDVWVVAATNRNLARAVEEGRFRQDLYYRLAQARIAIAPMRERPDDVEALVHGFVQRRWEDRDGPVPVVSPDLMVALQSLPLEGNVRELQSLVDTLVASCEGSLLTLDQLRAAGRSDVPGGADSPPTTWEAANAAFQERYLRWAVERWGPSAAEVAGGLAIHRTSLYKICRRYGIDIGGGNTGGSGS